MIAATLFFLLISASGTFTFISFTNIKKAEIALPAGILSGLSITIFLVNVLAYVSKGHILATLLIMVVLVSTLFLRKHRPTLPKNKFMWLTISLVWSTFLFYITRSARIDGADSTIHYSIASVFARGDFPVHSPWQPEFIVHYHTGWAQFFGIARLITNANFTFIQALIALLTTWSIANLLSFGFMNQNKYNIFIANIPPLVGLITLGGFFIAIPNSLNTEATNIINWVQNQPTLSKAFEVFGSPTDIDALIYFFHRLLSISFVIVAAVILKHEAKNSLKSAFLLAVLLCSIALVDESVFVISFPVVILFSFFKLFNKSLLKTAAFVIVVSIISALQGSVITETILNRYNEPSHVLIFPKDSNERLKNYRSYRLSQQSASIFTNNDSKHYSLFTWIHPGILWQLATLLILSLLSRNKKTLLFFLLIAISSYISFFVLVPKGMYHANGNRFLALSYQFSGIGVAFFIRDWLSKEKGLSKFIIIWVLAGSILPPIIISATNRPNNNWFSNPLRRKHTLAEQWILKNTSVKDRYLALVDKFPVNSGNIDLVREVGVMTPVWGQDIRAYDSFDTSPIFSDVFYTLNPNLLNELNIKYLMVNDNYLESIHPRRSRDLNNSEYFKKAYEVPQSIDSRNTRILEVLDKYLEAENIGGTFKELVYVAPKNGTYFIDYPPNITEGVFRILLLSLRNHEIYYNIQGSFYNSRLSVDTPYYGDFNKEKYDYYVLGNTVDPMTVCNCSKAELLWEGYGNNVILWKAR